MKTIFNVSSLLIAVLFLFASCEKDPLQPDKNALRISKMADNAAMENPILFQYNSDGLINKVVFRNYYESIEYDEQNRPIKWSEIEYGRPEYARTNNIEWTDAGFIITDDNWQEIYILDADGRILKRSTTKDGVLSDNYDEYTYVGESKVIIERKSTSEEILETTEIEFGDVYNPFHDFSVAIDISVHPDIEDGRGKYAFSSYINGLSWTATYEVNEQNYPISGAFIHNNSYEYWYYEYETD